MAAAALTGSGGQRGALLSVTATGPEGTARSSGSAGTPLSHTGAGGAAWGLGLGLVILVGPFQLGMLPVSTILFVRLSMFCVSKPLIQTWWLLPEDPPLLLSCTPPLISCTKRCFEK